MTLVQRMLDVFHFFLSQWWKWCRPSVTSFRQFVNPFSQQARKACSCRVLCLIHSVLSSSYIHPDNIFPLSVSQSISLVVNLSAPLLPPPAVQTSFPAPGCDVVTCLPVQWECPCSNVFVSEEVTRKQLARGKQLLFPTALSSCCRMPWGRTGSAALLLLSGRTIGRAKAR